MLSRFFSRQTVATPQPALETVTLTRFQKATELKGFSAALETLRGKYNEMKKIADAKGAQSNEYLISSMLGHIIDLADQEINKYNEMPEQSDHFLDVKDMLSLTDHLKPDPNTAADNQKALNKLATNDERWRNVRNASFGLTLLALPFAPIAIFGFGATAALAALTGLLYHKPAENFLKAIKAINEDTVSKEIVEDYINTLVKTNENLTKYIAENEVLHEQQLEHVHVAKPA